MLIILAIFGGTVIIALACIGLLVVLEALDRVLITMRTN